MLLDALNDLGFAYRWITPLDRPRQDAGQQASDQVAPPVVREAQVGRRDAARSDCSIARRRWSIPTPRQKAADADEALQELGSDDVAFGYLTATIVVADPDAKRANEKLRAVERIVNGRGFVTIRETLNAVEAWLVSLPGHAYANVRQPIVHTLNLAHMMPVSAVWAGPDGNRHLDGPPLMSTKTDGSTPFRLDLHVGDVGHTLVVGPTGAGKSVLLALLALQFRRYPGAQVVIFDKGRSARAAILGVGGYLIDLGLAGSLAFQPLAAHRRDRASGAAALEWVLALLAQRRPADHARASRRRSGPRWAASPSAPRTERTLTGLRVLVQSTRCVAALAALHARRRVRPHPRRRWRDR